MIALRVNRESRRKLFFAQSTSIFKTVEYTTNFQLFVEDLFEFEPARQK